MIDLLKGVERGFEAVRAPSKRRAGPESDAAGDGRSGPNSLSGLKIEHMVAFGTNVPFNIDLV
ncbi:MAG TPA: hypothetical protein VIT38_12190 [Allosphingosinicella sp.]